MVKKLKPDVLMIKELLSKGYRQCEISRLLKIKKKKLAIGPGINYCKNQRIIEFIYLLSQIYLF